MSLRTTIPPDPPFPIPTIYDSDALRAYWSTSHVLGVQIKPGFTDADRSSWPTNIERIVDEDGNVNYFTEANHKRLRDWKRKLGRLLVEEIVKPELKRRNSWETLTAVDESEIVLVNFPDNYKLFVHFSQESSAPREDTYLYGSKIVHQFRSPYEFVLHLVWIVAGQPLKITGEPDCLCTYCSGEKQMDIHTKHNFSKAELRIPAKKNPRSKSPTRKKQASTQIQFKDYTKLNLNNSASGS